MTTEGGGGIGGGVDDASGGAIEYIDMGIGTVIIGCIGTCIVIGCMGICIGMDIDIEGGLLFAPSPPSTLLRSPVGEEGGLEVVVVVVRKIHTVSA
jgi:hypothetical protein